MRDHIRGIESVRDMYWNSTVMQPKLHRRNGAFSKKELFGIIISVIRAHEMGGQEAIAGLIMLHYDYFQHNHHTKVRFRDYALARYLFHHRPDLPQEVIIAIVNDQLSHPALLQCMTDARRTSIGRAIRAALIGKEKNLWKWLKLYEDPSKEAQPDLEAGELGGTTSGPQRLRRSAANPKKMHRVLPDSTYDCRTRQQRRRIARTTERSANQLGAPRGRTLAAHPSYIIHRSSQHSSIW